MNKTPNNTLILVTFNSNGEDVITVAQTNNLLNIRKYEKKREHDQVYAWINDFVNYNKFGRVYQAENMIDAELEAIWREQKNKTRYGIETHYCKLIKYPDSR